MCFSEHEDLKTEHILLDEHSSRSKNISVDGGRAHSFEAKGSKDHQTSGLRFQQGSQPQSALTFAAEPVVVASISDHAARGSADENDAVAATSTTVPPHENRAHCTCCSARRRQAAATDFCGTPCLGLSRFRNTKPQTFAARSCLLIRASCGF